jgi:AhpD family alkylhydroperoxidase
MLDGTAATAKTLAFNERSSPMEARIDARKYAQDAQKAMSALETYLADCGLEHRLIHLLKMRASQINGCTYCIDMHSKDARALGETEQRLYELDAWRETPFYTDRERAALACFEAVTLVFPNARPRLHLRRSPQTLQRKRNRRSQPSW